MYFSLLAASLQLGITLADSNPPSCDANNACPEEYPCCSTEGTCGNGYVCLGGCDPRYSYQPGSCVAMPIYQSGDYSFNGTDGISTYKDFLGDAQKTPWNYLGNISSSDDNKLQVQLYKGGTGSTVYSSFYLWYGKVTARMKTSGGAGIISDIILLSNVKDEIDYEFVGYDTSNGQTNYYWHGLEDYHNMVKAAVSSDTENNYHEYTIDWQENQITWSVDGNTVRTLNKEDTKNQTTGQYAFPQTPARIEFGLWPGGDSNAQGTREWAGGQVNWDAGQGANPGYFFVEMDSISVQAYDPPQNVNKTGSKSYVYTSKDGVEGSIAITDEDYVLEATDGTGNNLAGPYGHKSSSAVSSSAASSSAPSSSLRSSSASSSAASSSAVSSSAVSSSAVSSSAASSSARSSSASSSAPSSSAKSSSAPSSSASSAASSAAPSSSAGSSSPSSASGASGSGNGGNGAGAAAGSATKAAAAASSTDASSAASSSAATSASSVAKNGAVQNVVPAVAALLPALLL